MWEKEGVAGKKESEREAPPIFLSPVSPPFIFVFVLSRFLWSLEQATFHSNEKWPNRLSRKEMRELGKISRYLAYDMRDLVKVAPRFGPSQQNTFLIRIRYSFNQSLTNFYLGFYCFFLYSLVNY